MHNHKSKAKRMTKPTYVPIVDNGKDKGGEISKDQDTPNKLG